MSQSTVKQAGHPKVVFLDRGGLPDSINVPALSTPSKWQDYPASTPAQVIERARDADILAINKIVISDEILRECKSVQHIAIAATGYNLVDLQACAKHGVSVSNIPHYAATTVPEHVISVALALRRELMQYRQLVIAGQWQRSPNFCLFDKPINDLANSVFGVIGFGQLGQATARLANALGMHVIVSSTRILECDFATQVSFDELITNADIISLHCSLNDSTKDLIDTAQLDAMKNNAILINTARGGIANEHAVAQAIKNGEIGGIGFDVLVQEPPADNAPLLALASLSNVIITPHTAWASQQAMQHLADILVDNIDAFINGTPQNLVI